MGRVNLTSGGSEDGRSRSKFRGASQTVFYFQVVGELDLTSRHPVLKEKDPKTGRFTGEEWLLTQGSLIGLADKYKKSSKLEVVCRIQDTKTSIGKGGRKSKHTYSISNVYSIQISKNQQEGEKATTNQLEPTNLPANTKQKLENIVIVENESQQRINYKGTKEQIEKYICAELQKVLGGKREVFTPDGDRIDLLTKSMLIEVKAASDWDNAIGQILKYKIHYPNHRLIIFLFDNGFDTTHAKRRLDRIIKSFLLVDIQVATTIAELKQT